MPVAPVLLSIVMVFVGSAAVAADRTVAADRADVVADAPSHPLTIRPDGKAPWRANMNDVQKVLESAAGVLWVHFPGRKLDPILVEPTGGPIVLYERGPRGEYHVRLNTGQTYWAQYSYQFAHEFCHILCNYTQAQRRNKWFEESLCEMASLFALRRMSQTWKDNPPYPNWRSFAPSLAKYADNLIAKGALPQGVTLDAWYRTNAEALAEKAEDRDRNRIVAVALLPLFEKQPQHWPAVGWLNAVKPAADQSFADYLSAWHRAVPDEHKAFVKQIADRFKIELGK